MHRADATLAHALARRDGVVTPDSATSPTDVEATVRIPHTVVAASDPDELDPESTVVITPTQRDSREADRR
ncbi:MAG: hypothetical protein GEV09_07735 [Pseudonocardiaceae bacterium]|nr:hypothetical protein [Pseudonocardiaceae bacterium]